MEAQIEASEAPRRQNRVELSPEQLSSARKIESLLLSRTRVRRDLETCQNPRYRKALEDGLAFLENQLAQLGWTG